MCGSCLLFGDPSGPRPVFLIEHTTHIRFQNIFANLHFKIVGGQLLLDLLDLCPVLFLQCSFESSATPSSKASPQETQRIQSEVLRQILANMGQSVEDMELKEKSNKERELLAMFENMSMGGNGNPSVVLARGRCAMMRCDISNQIAGGVLVENHSGQIMDLLLYMKSCVISNCGLSGVEVRQYGNLILEDCDINRNQAGVSVWMNASNVLIKGCRIYDNRNEGVLSSDQNMSFDNLMRVIIEDNSIHHNQIGLSLEYVKRLNVKSNKVFSNRSWGVYLRTSNVTSIRANNIFKNECGGIRVTLNRFSYTTVMKNLIHDHTGPDIVQTVFLSESQNQIPLLNREANRVPVMVMDNISYNNDLSHGSIDDWKTGRERPCSYCNGSPAHLVCTKCRKVKYCRETCKKVDRGNHETFCNYFSETIMVNLSRKPEVFSPANKLIKDERAKKKKKGYKNKEFLIKISCGGNGFGLDTEKGGTGLQKLAMMVCRQPDDDVLWVYDKFRFVCGTANNQKLFDVVRQFGKLSGEKVYNKRIYLYARMSKGNKNELIVRKDELVHEQGW